MKTKTIVTIVLFTMVYVLLVNFMFLGGMYQDEVVKVGWYSEFGGNSMTTVYSVYVLLNFPYIVCFYFFGTLFLAKVKAHVNKWLGETAFALWCISMIPILLNTVSNLYIVSCFNGDEMYRPLEAYWETEGKFDYPFMWFLISSRIGDWDWMYYLNLYEHLVYLAVLLAYTAVFALLIKKDKALGVTGVAAMAISFLIALLALPYAYLTNLCWIALCTVTLWRLHQSSPDKPFILQ